MESFKSKLLGWTSKLDRKERNVVNANGAGIFINLKQVKIETQFLDACLDSWDPKYHVFRFLRGELCPLVEEIAMIAGWSKLSLPVVVIPVIRKNSM